MIFFQRFSGQKAVEECNSLLKKTQQLKTAIIKGGTFMRNFFYILLFLFSCNVLSAMQPQKRKQPIIIRKSGTTKTGREYIEYTRRILGSPESIYITFYPQSGRYKVESEVVEEGEVAELRIEEPMPQLDACILYERVSEEYAENEMSKFAEKEKRQRIK